MRCVLLSLLVPMCCAVLCCPVLCGASYWVDSHSQQRMGTDLLDLAGNCMGRVAAAAGRVVLPSYPPPGWALPVSMTGCGFVLLQFGALGLIQLHAGTHGSVDPAGAHHCCTCSAVMHVFVLMQDACCKHTSVPLCHLVRPVTASTSPSMLGCVALARQGVKLVLLGHQCCAGGTLVAVDTVAVDRTRSCVLSDRLVEQVEANAHTKFCAAGC